MGTVKHEKTTNINISLENQMNKNKSSLSAEQRLSEMRAKQKLNQPNQIDMDQLDKPSPDELFEEAISSMEGGVEYCDEKKEKRINKKCIKGKRGNHISVPRIDKEYLFEATREAISKFSTIEYNQDLFSEGLEMVRFDIRSGNIPRPRDEDDWVFPLVKIHKNYLKDEYGSDEFWMELGVEKDLYINLRIKFIILTPDPYRLNTFKSDYSEAKESMTLASEIFNGLEINESYNMPELLYYKHCERLRKVLGIKLYQGNIGKLYFMVKDGVDHLLAFGLDNQSFQFNLKNMEEDVRDSYCHEPKSPRGWADLLIAEYKHRLSQFRMKYGPDIPFLGCDF